MNKLIEYITAHTKRGDCTCGRCIDAPAETKQPSGHTADLIFFKVAAVNNPVAEDLKKLIEQHESDYPCNLFNGNEHSYLEIGGFIGDQGYGLTLMGLGSLLGLWTLLTPRSVLGSLCTDEMAMALAGRGMITIQVGKGTKIFH